MTYTAGMIMATLAVVAAVAVYLAWMRHRSAQHDRDVEWDIQGIRPGMQAYACGMGERALIFVHGFASGPSVFRYIAPALAERGFDCRVMRLPGAGEPLARKRAVSEADWRQAIEQEVRRAQSDGKSVWLVGHSLGGALALDFTRRNPSTVDGVVLLAPLIEVSSRRSFGIPPHLMYRATRWLLPDWAVLGALFPVDLNARESGTMEVRDQYLPVAWYDALFRIANDVRSRGFASDTPALIVLPGADRIVSRRASLRFFSRLDPDRSRLITGDKAGHVLPLDYGWPDVVDEMHQFIQANARSGS